MTTLFLALVSGGFLIAALSLARCFYWMGQREKYDLRILKDRGK